MYSINTTGKSFETKNARKAAEVAISWKNRGMEPKAWVGNIGPNGYEASEVAITTTKQTAAAMVAATR